MRNLFLLVLISTVLSASAQELSGVVKSTSGEPLNGATVSLMKASDSSIVKLAITKKDGAFSISGVKDGSYRVLASFVGHTPVITPVHAFQSANLTVGEIKLPRLSGTMSNVTVAVQRPVVEARADRIILNVEGTINATGSNALELLRKSPGVLLDKDDNIIMAGKNGVQVYVDGRSTPLTGQDLAHYLKTIQSNQVEAIELITNPSAKYDAAGNAGIINIRLVRNKSIGANGSVNAGWNIGTTSKYVAGGSLNYRNNRVNIFSNYSFSYTPNQQRLEVYRTVLDTLFDQYGNIHDLRRTHSIKAGIDYFINKKNTFGLMVNTTLADPTSVANSRTLISNTTTGNADRLLMASNHTRMKRNNANLNANYTFNDPKGKNLVVNIDRGSYDFSSNQLQSNNYFDPAGTVQQHSIRYRIVSPSNIRINSVKADYDQNLWKGKLGLGGKTAWIKTDNDFQRLNIVSSGEELDKDRSNRFLYKENISAGYFTYTRQLKKIMFYAGLRVEHTSTTGVSTSEKGNGGVYVPHSTSFERNYTDLFPSAGITFNKNPRKQWSVSYSRRIDRPAYQDLNPFEYRLDEYTFMKGNINLRPQYTNTIGITHTYNFKLNVGLNYSHVNDMFTQIIDTVEKSRAFISKKNLATQDIVNLTISYPFQYKRYSLFANLSSNYAKYQADFGTGRKVDLAAAGLNLFLQNSLKLTNTCTAELTAFYNAPTIYMGTFRGKSVYSMDLGLSRQMMKNRATVKASVSDVFHTMRFAFTSDFAGQAMRVNYRNESRQLKLSFTYRFGKTGVKPARQRSTGAEEEAKRVQSSGGLLGSN